MGLDYALVHLKYTIPPGILLSLLYKPLLTRTDCYKIVILIAIAVFSTIPWDSYLIRKKIWTYPPRAIIGPRIFQIPVEEVFFFIIQTYNTSLFYLLLSKATFFPIYLRAEKGYDSSKATIAKRFASFKAIGQLLLGFTFSYGVFLIQGRGKGTYFGLIIAWATPFLLLLWSFAYQFLIGLPWTNTVLPIALPTLYLWIVDTLALRRGTWSIESGTKLGICIWPHLEIEEAFFFLITNCLVVFGLVAFDNALAILHTFSPTTQVVSDVPSPAQLMTALFIPAASYDETFILGLQEAVKRLKSKSRSFFLASSIFQGKLRAQLIILYSFCRVADDLVDNSKNRIEAEAWISKLKTYLDLRYNEREKAGNCSAEVYIQTNFPAETQSTFSLLPTELLSKDPLYDLLKGFETDLAFTGKARRFPIRDDVDLELYGLRVAGTVAQLCNELVFASIPNQSGSKFSNEILASGRKMGVALQCINIARDIAVDAELGRVYIPTTWLEDTGLTPQQVLQDPRGPKIEALRARLLDKAFSLYEGARGAIEELPLRARAPMRVAVESYMEIGRVLREGRPPIKHGRATVPRFRRILVAWNTLS